MDIQTIIVGIILLLAMFYVGKMIVVKLMSFSTSSNCGDACGCSSGSTKKLTQIQRN